MTIGPNTTLRKLAFIVGTALEEAEISAVLSGGGAASVYAPELNQSFDLDFILSFSSIGVSADCLIQLGFEKENSLYVHKETPFTLEFPKGPLMIGEEFIESWSTMREDGMILNILNPTDCVRDRLSWFLFYNAADYAALEQALGVALTQEVDLEKIRSWAMALGAGERYKVFEARYRAGRAELQ